MKKKEGEAKPNDNATKPAADLKSASENCAGSTPASGTKGKVMTEETAPTEEKKEPYQRQCEGCTKCCEGWLSANLHGHTMHRGKKCHFVSEGKGCAIYEHRPENPCVGFLCAWRYDYNIPEWFKPDKSNVICMWKKIGEDENTIHYLHVVECDKVLDVKVLSWLIHHQINYCYTLYGQPMYAGSPEFIAAINESFK